jgi:hypothetical protein
MLFQKKWVDQNYVSISCVVQSDFNTEDVMHKGEGGVGSQTRGDMIKENLIKIIIKCKKLKCGKV